MSYELEDISFKELLGYSIKGEETAYKAYMNISETLSGLPADRFQSLAEEELDHKKKLLNLHDYKFGDKDYIAPEKEGLPPHEGDLIDFDPKKLNSFIEALESAIEAEKNAYELYYQLAKREKNHSLLFNYIAIMEKGHQFSLEEEKEMYEKVLKNKGGDASFDELNFLTYE
ncbi:MAG: ferritin family protein [Thermoplasmatota archaeon]